MRRAVKMFCGHCGVKTTEGNNFCTECGKGVKKTDEGKVIFPHEENVIEAPKDDVTTLEKNILEKSEQKSISKSIKKSIFGIVGTLIAAFLIFSFLFRGIQDSTPSPLPPENTEPETTVSDVIYEQSELDVVYEQDAFELPAEIHPLVGTWAWDEDDTYRYIFHADGTGERGFVGMLERFEWEQINLAGFIRIHSSTPLSTGLYEEQWLPTITEDRLTLTNANPFMRFVYHRVNLTDEVEATLQQTPVAARGIWEGNTFTNDFLGLQFNMPDGWNVVTGTALPTILYEGAEISDYAWSLLEEPSLLDMSVNNPIGGGNLNIVIDRHCTSTTDEDFRQIVLDTIPELEAYGVSVTIGSFDEPIRIGRYYWYYLETEMDILGSPFIAHHFVTMRGRYIGKITISGLRDDTLEDILALFTSP